jgi:hypothetical protein
MSFISHAADLCDLAASDTGRPPMRRLIAATLATLALSSALAGCATVAPRLDAAADVHALLIAIRDNDRAMFDRLVDRPALKAEIQSRLMDETRRDGRVPAVLAAILAPAVADVAGEALIRPEVFRGLAEAYGYRRDTPIPGPLIISTLVRPRGDGLVCAATSRGGPCDLVFAHGADGRWRLAGYDGDLSRLRIGR